MEDSPKPSVIAAITSMEIGQNPKKRKKDLLDAFERSVLDDHYLIRLNFQLNQYNIIKAFSRDEFTLDRIKDYCMEMAKVCEVDNNKDLRPLLLPHTVFFKYLNSIIADDRTLLCLYLKTKDEQQKNTNSYRWSLFDINVCWPGSDPNVPWGQ